MLIDANLLLYAVDDRSEQHTPTARWLDEQLNGFTQVGLPWSSLGAFLRVITNPRITADPLSAQEAWERVVEWLASDMTWIPTPGPRHAEILGELVTRYHITGNLVPDAQLAALGIEHGLVIYSADSDFARFPEVRWINPLH
jgi:toxin-antitoxin system PIN domain toxin